MGHSIIFGKIHQLILYFFLLHSHKQHIHFSRSLLSSPFTHSFFPTPFTSFFSCWDEFVISAVCSTEHMAHPLMGPPEQTPSPNSNMDSYRGVGFCNLYSGGGGVLLCSMCSLSSSIGDSVFHGGGATIASSWATPVKPKKIHYGFSLFEAYLFLNKNCN